MLLQRMSSGPIAEQPEKANEQHYELPAAFMELLLGPRLKYSGCLWRQGVGSLAEAEEAMLEATCGRAGIADGMRVLDLGCGWGSLSLWIAQHYPNAEVVAVSNSHAQRCHIEARAARDRLANLCVKTADVNELEVSTRFDRIVSIEMFEHMRNWRELLRRISTWLEPDGRAFVHVFSHHTLPYRFESTWAAERFFSFGLMPSHEPPSSLSGGPPRPRSLGGCGNALRENAGRLAREPRCPTRGGAGNPRASNWLPRGGAEAGGDLAPLPDLDQVHVEA